MPTSLAIYIHWPFCQSKCPYCDFNSFVAGGIDHAVWRAAYRRELEHYASLLPNRHVTSVFFGGGTPSLMEVETVASILENIRRLWVMDDDVEITLEANPGSSEAAKFAGFRAAGVNRLSLGMQALRDEDLQFLGRAHNVAEGRRAIELARRHFDHFSFDLIYARRGQSTQAWEAELGKALALADGHLSLYQLTIEPNTAFHTRALRGEALTAEENPSVEMYELTQQIMCDAGRPAYEISNHAKPGRESRHNLTYWRYEEYIGVGPGAHGRIRRRKSEVRSQKKENSNSTSYLPTSVFRLLATDNHRSPDVWLRQVMELGNGLRTMEELSLESAMREALMMGLRLVDGIGLQNWREKFGVEMDAFLPPEKLQRLMQENYLLKTENKLCATASGLQRLNAILGYLFNC